MRTLDEIYGLLPGSIQPRYDGLVVVTNGDRWVCVTSGYWCVFLRTDEEIPDLWKLHDLGKSIQNLWDLVQTVSGVPVDLQLLRDRIPDVSAYTTTTSCEFCDGAGTLTCPTCDGECTIECDQGHKHECHDCGSTGTTTCIECEHGTVAPRTIDAGPVYVNLGAIVNAGHLRHVLSILPEMPRVAKLGHSDKHGFMTLKTQDVVLVLSLANPGSMYPCTQIPVADIVA